MAGHIADDFESHLNIVRDALRAAETYREVLEIAADHLQRLLIFWGDAHWAEIEAEARTNRRFAQAMTGVMPTGANVERFGPLIDELGVRRHILMDVSVMDCGMSDEPEYVLGPVRFRSNLTSSDLEALGEPIGPHIERRFPTHVRRRSGNNDGLRDEDLGAL